MRFSMTNEQWKTLGKQALKYTAPLLVVFLVQIQAGQPLETALFTVYGAALQLAINFLSKFVSE